MVVGLVIAGVGVGIAKSVVYIHFPGSDYVLDYIGYGFHGLGLVPFIEHLAD